MSDRKRTAAAVALSAASLLLAAELDKYEGTNRKKKIVNLVPTIPRNIRDFTNVTEEFLLNIEYVKENLRITNEVFDLLLTLIEADTTKPSDSMAITPKEQLISTLHFLISGCSFKQVDPSSKLSEGFLSMNIPKICEAIYNNLKDAYLEFPTSDEDWINIAQQFGIQWQFPLCIGALGARHIEFEVEDYEADIYLNYKGSHSIVLLALTDAECRFTCIDVGCNGAVNFDDVLECSQLWEVIQSGESHFPPAQQVSENKVLPYVLVADNTFPLHNYIMTPYADTNELRKKIYNQRHSVAKQTVDHSFRILTNRFKILDTKMRLEVEKVQTIVLACCVLHNFLMAHSDGYGTIQVRRTEEIKSPVCIKEPSQNSLKIRSLYTDYFSNEGRI